MDNTEVSNHPSAEHTEAEGAQDPGVEKQASLEEKRKNLFRGAPGTDGSLAHLSGGNPDLSRVLEIPLTLHVELGRKSLRIREVIDMKSGSVIELDTDADNQLTVYANQTLIARGEAVLVGKRYGVRITEIISPLERVRNLGGKAAKA